jgi:hypothetical protein
LGITAWNHVVSFFRGSFWRTVTSSLAKVG